MVLERNNLALHGNDDGQYSAVGFVETSKTFAMQDKIFIITQPFDRVLFTISQEHGKFPHLESQQVMREGRELR